MRDVFRTERDEGEGEGLLLGHSGWVEAVSWERVGGEVFRGSARGGEKSRVAAFRDALEEAREVVTANGGDPRLGVDAFGGVGGEKDGEDGEDCGRGVGDEFVWFAVRGGGERDARGVRPCGVVGDEGLKLKTARGRCRLCQKLHKDGQFCPVCDRVWHWSAGDPMVGCDRCDKWIHRVRRARRRGVG